MELQNYIQIMILLKYKQSGTKPHIFVELYGVKTLVYQPGIVDYDQEEEVEETKLNERIKELKSFTNRNYHSFSVKTI